jgi:uncharacterized alkaline shock family protein YloU
MKLVDRLLLWVLSLLAVVLSLLLLLLILFPAISWLQVPAVRIAVGVLAFLCILSAIVLLLRHKPRQQEEAALVSDGENGSAYVTLSVLNDMARRIAQETEGVRTCRSKVQNNGSGVDVELEMALNPGVAVAPLAAMLQERLKGRVLEMTGIHVGKVSIMVEAAAEGKEPKPAPVEQLPGQVK